MISFHSLEDRMVKQCIAAAARPAAAHARLPLRESELPQPLVRSLGKVVADDVEVAGNARARSAILRVAERTGERCAWRRGWFRQGRPGARRAGARHARRFQGEASLMGRTSLIVAALLMLSAISLVTSRYQSRQLFIELGRSQAEARDLDTNWRRLQLERAELARNARIDRAARDDLKMIPIVPDRTLYMNQPAGGAQ